MPDKKPPPLKGAEVERKIKPRDAQSQELRSVTKRFFVAGGAEPPRLEAKVVPIRDPQDREQNNYYERYSKPHVTEKKKRPRAASNASS